MMKLLFILMALLLSSCGGKLQPDAALASKIKKRINEKQTGTLAVDSLAAFDWDTILILKPYTTDEQVRSVKSVITNLHKVNLNLIRHREDLCLLVFTRQGRVKRVVEMPRYPCCDFAGIFQGKNPAFLRRRDSLRISQVSDGNRLAFRLERISFK